MIEFVRTRFYQLSDDADVQAAFEEFSKEKQKAEIEEFSYENDIDYTIVTDIMTDYIFTGQMTDESIRQRLAGYHFGLLKMTQITDTLKRFVEKTYLKYRAEGE